MRRYLANSPEYFTRSRSRVQADWDAQSEGRPWNVHGVAALRQPITCHKVSSPFSLSAIDGFINKLLVFVQRMKESSMHACAERQGSSEAVCDKIASGNGLLACMEPERFQPWWLSVKSLIRPWSICRIKSIALANSKLICICSPCTVKDSRVNCLCANRTDGGIQVCLYGYLLSHIISPVPPFLLLPLAQATPSSIRIFISIWNSARRMSMLLVFLVSGLVSSIHKQVYYLYIRPQIIDVHIQVNHWGLEYLQ